MGPTGTWSQVEVGKGGANGRRTQQWKQACVTGRKDERRRLAGGGWEKKSRWTIIHAGRGWGERERESGEAELKDNDRGTVGVGGTG